jgi:hypothetical protein
MHKVAYATLAFLLSNTDGLVFDGLAHGDFMAFTLQSRLISERRMDRTMNFSYR